MRHRVFHSLCRLTLPTKCRYSPTLWRWWVCRNETYQPCRVLTAELLLPPQVLCRCYVASSSNIHILSSTWTSFHFVLNLPLYLKVFRCIAWMPFVYHRQFELWQPSNDPRNLWISDIVCSQLTTRTFHEANRVTAGAAVKQSLIHTLPSQNYCFAMTPREKSPRCFLWRQSSTSHMRFLRNTDLRNFLQSSSERNQTSWLWWVRKIKK